MSEQTSALCDTGCVEMCKVEGEMCIVQGGVCGDVQAGGAQQEI